MRLTLFCAAADPRRTIKMVVIFYCWRLIIPTRFAPSTLISHWTCISFSYRVSWTILRAITIRSNLKLPLNVSKNSKMVRTVNIYLESPLETWRFSLSNSIIISCNRFGMEGYLRWIRTRLAKRSGSRRNSGGASASGVRVCKKWYNILHSAANILCLRLAEFPWLFLLYLVLFMLFSHLNSYYTVSTNSYCKPTLRIPANYLLTKYSESRLSWLRVPIKSENSSALDTMSTMNTRFHWQKRKYLHLGLYWICDRYNDIFWLTSRALPSFPFLRSEERRVGKECA
jgi:hypothetical protein